MKTTKVQLLRNPDIQPTSDIITKALSKANTAYIKFVNELANRDIQLVWRYYNDGKAWLAKGLHKRIGVRGGVSEKTVLWLSIWENFFKVTIYIPEKYRLEVYDLPFDDDVKSIIANSKQMGKLKFFPLAFDVDSDEVFTTIFSLVDFIKSTR